MIKTIATLTAFAALTFLPAHAHAEDNDATTFEASIFVNSSASVEETYKRIERQSRSACKQQLRTVKNLSTRLDYMRSCKAELIEASVKEVKNAELTRYHAARTTPAQVRQFAGEFN